MLLNKLSNFTKSSLVASSFNRRSIKVFFHVHSNTDIFYLLQSWAQSQMQHSSLLHIWASRILCLMTGSNCVHPVSPWQNWSLYVSLRPSQSPQIVLARFSSFFTRSSSISPTNCSTSTFLISSTHCSLCILCRCNHKEEKTAKSWWQKWHLWHLFGWDETYFCNIKVEVSVRMVEKLRYLAQKSVPTEHIFLLRARLFLVAFVPHFSYGTWWFRLTESIFSGKCLTENWTNRTDCSNLILAMQSEKWALTVFELHSLVYTCYGKTIKKTDPHDVEVNYWFKEP